MHQDCSLPAANTGQTECIWLAGISTFRYSPEDQSDMDHMHKGRGALTSVYAGRPNCATKSSQAPPELTCAYARYAIPVVQIISDHLRPEARAVGG